MTQTFIRATLAGVLALGLAGAARAQSIPTPANPNPPFPIATDGKKKSMKLLNRLIATRNFDANSKQIRALKLPKDFQYHYWGDRLGAILIEVKADRLRHGPSVP